MKLTLPFAAALLAVVTASVATRQAPDVPASKVDAVFSRWTRDTPGCAIGVARAGRPVLEKAYGMADLEHDVPNAPDTIFEAGSVSKQFTAAAVLLLARDGRLSRGISSEMFLRLWTRAPCTATVVRAPFALAPIEF